VHKQSNSCRCRADQRHNTGCPAFEVKVCYPFHPRNGKIVVAIGRKHHAGVEHFVVRQPDGTLALLPAWMAEPRVSTFEVMISPRLSISRLVDLRGLIDTLLSSSSGESSRRRGTQHETRTTPRARSVRERQAIAEDRAPSAREDHDACSGTSNRGHHRTRTRGPGHDRRGGA